MAVERNVAETSIPMRNKPAFGRFVRAADYLALAVVIAITSGLPLTARCVGSEAATHFQCVGVRSFKSAQGIYQWSFEAKRGPSSFDRIGLERVSRGPNPPSHPGIVVLFLPGTYMNGKVALDDPRYSMPLYMAVHGVDFWSFDYRTHFVPPMMPIVDLGEMRQWTDALFESDIAAAADFVMATTGESRIFVSGFSRGVSFAYLYAAQHPRNVKGLLLLDGWIFRMGAGRPQSNRVVDDVAGKHLTWKLRNALLEDVIRDPGGPAPLAKYKTAADNLAQVLYHSASFGGHGGLANAPGGYSNPVILAHQLLAMDRYWPAVQDSESSLGPNQLRALGLSHIPVMAFSSTNISPQWPQQVARSAHSTGSRDVTVIKLAGWGHLDVICGTHAERDVFAPSLLWLRQHQKQGDNPNRSRRGLGHGA